MAAQAKHSCMPGTSEGDHAHVSPTILTCPFEVKMTLAVAKYLGSSLNNNIIMESESRKEKIQSPSMLLAKGIILTFD